jgi:hypothetical protein
MTQSELKLYVKMLNQVFEIEKKSEKLTETNSISRNISKLKDIFEDDIDETISIILQNPIGEDYKLTRTDCSADIAGTSTENLIVIEVIKPIIRVRQNGKTQIMQKGVVVVQDKNTVQEVKKNISGGKSYDGSKKKDRKGIRQNRKLSASKQSKQAKRRNK